MMEESRKQFEEWWGSAGRGLIIINYDAQRELQWAAWQASRAAIEVDVGEEPESERPDYYTGRDEVIGSIRAAGLKIKGE